MLNALLTFLRGSKMTRERTRAVLRDERTEGDVRYLSATYSTEGNLVIEGQDIGDGVEAAFGCREYEWTWTIARADLPKLLAALHAESSLLNALEVRFRGPAAAQLGSFLKENNVPYESWSRIGD